MKNKPKFDRALAMLKRSSPTILTIAAAVGVVATAVSAARATPKAWKKINDASYFEAEDIDVVLPASEQIKVAWKCYIPTALIACGTIGCLVGANILNKRHQAELVSAYALIKESYDQYRGAAKIVYGEDADNKIKAEMAKRVYVGDHTGGAFVYTPDMDDDAPRILCYDLYSKRYFHSTLAAVINAELNLNRNLANRSTATLNEFYRFLGLDEIDGGDVVGWSIDEILESTGWMWLDFENYKTDTDDGLECFIISSRFSPENIEEYI